MTRSLLLSSSTSASQLSPDCTPDPLLDELLDELLFELLDGGDDPDLINYVFSFMTFGGGRRIDCGTADT